MVQSNIKYPCKVSHNNKVIECETFGELVHTLKKNEGALIIDYILQKWTGIIVYSLRNYSIVVNVSEKSFIVYYDLDNVGMIHRYKWDGEVQGLTKFIYDKALYSRELPKYVLSQMKIIENKFGRLNN